MTSRWGHLYVAAILLLLALPLVVVTGVSLNGGQTLRFPPQDLSLRWYGELFRAADWMGPLRNSLVIAAAPGANRRSRSRRSPAERLPSPPSAG